MAKQWMPLPPGIHIFENTDFVMEALLDGSLLSMRPIDEDEHYDELNIQLDPSEYRLCRLTDAPSVPVEDIRTVLEEYVEIYNPNIPVARRLRAWLDAQEGQG